MQAEVLGPALEPSPGTDLHPLEAPAVGRRWVPRDSPRLAQGPSPPRGPVSAQSEDKYRCVSDSQCGPERFPSGGEWSPFLPPHTLGGGVPVQGWG